MDAQQAQQQAPAPKPQPQPFNPREIRRAYTESQWTMKEDWYVNQVNAISMPANPTTADLSHFASSIENVLSIARLDMVYIEQNYNKYNIQCKLQESILFTGLKQIQNGGKLTIDEKKSYIAQHLNTTPWNGGKLTLYELREKSDMRYVFLNGIIKSLMDKKDLLIIHSSAVKTDATLNAFTPNVPRTN